MRKIIVSVTNDLVTDNRVHKVCTSLSNSGFEVLLVGRRLPFSQKITRNYKTYRFSLIFNKGFLFYSEFNIRLFFYLLFSKTDILLANDLDTLPANYFISRINRKNLVFDSHEYFTEVPELIHRKRVRNFWLCIERRIVPKISNCYTVCQSLSDEYLKKYNTVFSVVRNVPFFIKGSVLPYEIDLPKDKKIILYQGALNVGRGIELVIASLKYLSNTVFVIAGNGDIADKLKQYSVDLGVQNKVVFLGRIPFEQLHSITLKADLGISLEENMGLNYYYSLPNKIFDYIHAMVPVLSSDFPEQKKIVEGCRVGETTDEKDPQKLALLIDNMLNDEIKRAVWKRNLIIASKELCWENEEKKLLLVFENLK